MFWGFGLPKSFGIVCNAVNMMKSRLLGRLLRGEEVRRRPCPVHKGRMTYFLTHDDYECCQGTGWLLNESEAADG